MSSINLSENHQVVYERTKTGLPPVRRYVASVWERRPLIWHLARTAMKSQHYDTAMGKLWIIFDPLLMAGTFYLIRAVFTPGLEVDARNLLIAHLIMAISFFYYIQALVMDCGRAIVTHQTMVLNTSVPRGVFPVVALMRAVIDLVPALGVYFVMHLLTGQPWGLSLLWLPLIVLLLTGFAVGVGLAISPLIVFYRDVANLIPYMMRIWMYVTPVLFSVREIPPGFFKVFQANPLYPFYAMFDRIFFDAKPPHLHHLGIAAVYATVALIGGGISFLLKERDYAVRL